MSESNNNLNAINSGRLILSDRIFKVCFGLILAFYAILLIGMLAADGFYLIDGAKAGENPILEAISQPEIQNSIYLSLISCSLSAFLSIIVAIPTGYILANSDFKGKQLLDSTLDIPIVLPPLVVGISLLIMFQFPPFTVALSKIFPFFGIEGDKTLNEWVVYQVPAVILAQFTVAAAFAIRTLKVSFEQIDGRHEQVALTLGCSRFQAFYRVVLPQAAPGIVTAWTLAWARSLGEFGPLLIFAGATRNKTEVLSTTVFLEMSIGNLQSAVAVSIIMVAVAFVVLMIARIFGKRGVLI